MKQLPWLPCFRPSRKTGRKQKKGCHSRCLPFAGFISCIVVFYLMNTVHLSSHIRVFFSAQVVHRNPRGPGFGAHAGKPHMPINDRPLPPSYVCYRCGQKGSPYSQETSNIYSPSFKGHWIQDCPTNNDRDFDHRPRIKRTTGIPRSMLKAVDNPNASGELGQGVMVTPEGGYVVAKPDL